MNQKNELKVLKDHVQKSQSKQNFFRKLSLTFVFYTVCRTFNVISVKSGVLRHIMTRESEVFFVIHYDHMSLFVQFIN